LFAGPQLSLSVLFSKPATPGELHSHILSLGSIVLPGSCMILA